MTADAPDAAAQLFDLPGPLLSFEMLIAAPDEDWERFLPLAPAGATVTGESIVRMPIRARSLSEALILAAALESWTKVPGARCEVRPA